MSIRRTRTRSSGEHYFTFRLVRSERSGANVRQRTLINLGRHFEVAPHDWPVLCDRMKTAVTGEDRDGRVIYNLTLQSLMQHYGAVPRACRPYRARTKE